MSSSPFTYPDRYLPIAEHGIIGNLHTTALVSVTGSIDFMCLPRFDSPTVFGRILDADKGGFFAFECVTEGVQNKQLYLPGTNILITRFLGEDGIAELTDFMPIVEGERDFAVFRRLKGVYGHHRVRVKVAPRYNYGKAGVIAEKNPGGRGYRLRDPEGKQPTMLLLCDLDLEITDEGLSGIIDLHQDDNIDFILTLEEGIDFDLDWMNCFNECRRYWTDWSAKCHYDGVWREAVLRSALALKLLTSARYGSTIAAATFGLPEKMGGPRNWDYRYTWIRDAAFTMYAFLRLGYTHEAEQFMDWIRDKCMHHLQLMYAVDGETNLEEETLEHLEGYHGSRPVRIGNGAYNQKQLDIYGELIDTIYLYNKAGGSITHAFWQSIVVLVEYVVEHWHDKDHGIWEVRSGKQRFLHSAVCCWVAIDRAMKIADDRSLPCPYEEWRKVRDDIYAEIYDGYWNEDLQAYVQYKGSDVLDASALLMPLLRFVSSQEPRWISTFNAIEENLSADVLIFRYKLEHGAADGLEGDEGAFAICSFWYVECLARIGQLDKATVVFEKMLGYANHLGLLSEEIGLHGEQLGNFPQAFSHLSLISAAFQINKKKR
ncbi:GH15 family glucan-1,4-alpha-glucosidase [Lewinella marina]|uniref:Glucoamylase n=1 Tax=Neolewinella marina TaxID=438751 RepID=A0A2G0CG54_9BACT|nr:glycoside hydrolase family 15 protein [Neolewinella marina]NJB86598.1 GH15 family glucan-1,4-alpha-glucosidase [Neolewinella marina]PHK98951.1 glucoamylase [Neolewinella marina]